MCPNEILELSGISEEMAIGHVIKVGDNLLPFPFSRTHSSVFVKPIRYRTQSIGQSHQQTHPAISLGAINIH